MPAWPFKSSKQQLPAPIQAGHDSRLRSAPHRSWLAQNGLRRSHEGVALLGTPASHQPAADLGSRSLVSPVQAIVQERSRDWRARFAPKGINIVELTGDSIDSATEPMLRDADIMCVVASAFLSALSPAACVRTIRTCVSFFLLRSLTTPEKFDSATRRNKDRGGMSFFADIALFMIDEVHKASLACCKKGHNTASAAAAQALFCTAVCLPLLTRAADSCARLISPAAGTCAGRRPRRSGAPASTVILLRRSAAALPQARRQQFLVCANWDLLRP